MKIQKPTKTIVALVTVVVLAAVIGVFYWKTKKTDPSKKIGAEEVTEEETTSTPEEETNHICTACEGEEPMEDKHPIEPLDISPTAAKQLVTQP
ncbi:MAG: hypothetical protein ACRBFS_21590 [Aureispira sp.]